MADSSKAVFLSYASQDAEAARRLCETLRSSGVEVWFDADGGLEHGDEWDAKIRRQIKECVLFIPIISATTQAREEGYFRIEWELAAQRALGIASGVAFILPVVIDDTREPEALVPDRFRAVQWTKLRGGEVTPEVKARLLKLWSHRTGALRAEGAGRRADGGGQTTDDGRQNDGGSSSAFHSPPSAHRRGTTIFVAAAVIIAAVLALWRPWQPNSGSSNSKLESPNSKPAAPAAPAAPSEARKLVLQARASIDDDWLAGRENFRLADELCEHATRLDPIDGEAWATWSRVASMMIHRQYDTSRVRREAARSRAERALQLAPASVEAGLAMALVLDQNGSGADAAQRLRELLQVAPRDARVARALAFAYSPSEKKGTPEGTEIRLHHPAFGGRDPRPLFDEARTLHDSGRRLGEAEALMDQASALPPCWEGYSFRLAYNIYSVVDLDTAEKLVEELPARLLQEDVFAMLVAKLWLARGNGEKARSALARVSRDFIEDRWFYVPKAGVVAETYVVAGRLAAAAEQWKEALAVIEKRLQAEPNEPGLLVQKSELLARLGRKDEALQVWKVARELGRMTYATIYEARLHLANGEREEAIQRVVRTLGDVRETPLISLNLLRLDPVFAPIRTDPRIATIIAKTEAMIVRLRQKPPAAEKKTAEVVPAVAPDAKSVAVLPFVDASDDKANQVFADGLSEELINVLGRVPGLKVTGRTSAFYFKSRTTPIPEIARQLGVAQVIDGSVRKAGRQVRITASLVNAADGFQVWTDTFTRDLNDAFALQDEIAGVIAKKLQLTVGVAPAGTHAADPQALQLYFQGREAWNLRTAEGYVRAEELFNRALAIDPAFARAIVGRADVWMIRDDNRLLVGLRRQRDSAELRRILAEIDRALALEPGLPEAHASLGYARWLAWDPEGSERELRLAVKLNPNYTTARHWLGVTLQPYGRVTEALAEFQRAAELDPMTPRIAINYARALLWAARPQEALALAERAAALQAGNPQIMAYHAHALLEVGRMEEAVSLARRVLALKDYHIVVAVRAFVRAGLKAEIEQSLAAMSDPGLKAIMLGRAGRMEECLAQLKPDDLAQYYLPELFYDPAFDAGRQDPRFVRVLEAAGATAAHARAQAERAEWARAKGAGK